MRGFSRCDSRKIRSIVEEAVAAYGGRILEVVQMKTIFKFHVVDCDLGIVQDCINQWLGKYGYDWESWPAKPNLLKFGWATRGCL